MRYDPSLTPADEVYLIYRIMRRKALHWGLWLTVRVIHVFEWIADKLYLMHEEPSRRWVKGGYHEPDKRVGAYRRYWESHEW